VPLIKAALSHKGAAFIDCISPCVQFNNHLGSTKSFDYVREHNMAMNRLDVIAPHAPIEIDHAPGTVEMVTQHDGSILALRKLSAHYDPSDRSQALAHLQERAAAATQIKWINTLATTQADFMREMSAVYFQTVRDQLK